MHEKSYELGNDPLGEYRHDLNRQKHGEANADAEQQPVRTLMDIKTLYNHYHEELSDDQLKSITIIPTGSRLEEGAKYLDLSDTIPHEFVAHAEKEVEPHNYYVAKNQLDYPLWNYLIGVRDPARLDQGEAEA